MVYWCKVFRCWKKLTLFPTGYFRQGKQERGWGVVIIQHTNVNVSLYVGYRDNYVYIVLQINFELVRRHPQQIGGVIKWSNKSLRVRENRQWRHKYTSLTIAHIHNVWQVRAEVGSPLSSNSCSWVTCRSHSTRI